jgi:hypothetical protein
MLSVQKYRQTKNQVLLEFLKNNQVCAIKKHQKNMVGPLLKKSGTNKTSTN